MKNYNCEICKFESNNKTNYINHLHTKIHIINITPKNQYCCNVCLKIFKYKSSLCTHKKLYCNKKINEEYDDNIDSYNNDSNNNDNNSDNDNDRNNKKIDNILIENLLLKQKLQFVEEKAKLESKLMKEKIELESKLVKEKTEKVFQKEKTKLLKENNKEKTKLLKENNKQLLKSKDKQIDLVQQNNVESVRHAYSEGKMNALTFVSVCYNKTSVMPSIPLDATYVVADVKSDKEIKYWIEQKPNFTDEYIAERLLHIYDSKGFANYITKIVEKAYKKDDPSEQTFWASDVSRLIYIVRSTIDQKDEWVYDKKGCMIKESIIDPLLDEVYNIIVKYKRYMEDKYLHSLKKEESDYYMSKVSIITVANKLINDFRNRQAVKNQIIRVLAPKFFLDRDINKLQDIKKQKQVKKQIEYQPPKIENNTIFDKIKNKKLEESKQIVESSEDTEEFLKDPRVISKMQKELLNSKKSSNELKEKSISGNKKKK
jgi:hypothetical protein